MNKTVICLVIAGVIYFAIKLTFAQDAKLINEDDAFTTQAVFDTNAMLTNFQDNNDVTLMPFVPLDNSAD